MTADTCHNWPERIETLKSVMQCPTWQIFADRIGIDVRSIYRWRTRMLKPIPAHAAIIEQFEQQYVFTDLPKESQK